jgi:simple sugar transport system permease protein
MTAFLLRTMFGRQGTFTDPDLQGLSTSPGTDATDLPRLGARRPSSHVFLRRHVWGFRLQGVGEAPEAARSLGVDTAKYRYGACSPAVCCAGSAEPSSRSATSCCSPRT